MDTLRERQLFESLARSQPALRDWLVEKLAKEHDQLVHLKDSDQLRQAQGRAQAYQTLIRQLDSSTR